jgi:predicted dehydrogenase
MEGKTVDVVPGTGSVRVGVVGTSNVSDGMHLRSLVSHPRATVVALCGRDQDKARRVAAKHDIEHVYAGYQRMLQAGGLDAVVVATPDDLHYPMTMAAVERGLHVLCEKPLANSARRALEMYESAERAGIVHMTNLNYRSLPHFRYFRDLVEQGYLGRPLFCSLEYVTGVNLANRSYRWLFDLARGKGALAALGVHVIDAARWCFGEISRVAASTEALVPLEGTQAPASDSACLSVEYESGVHGYIRASFVALGSHRIRIHAEGETGMLELYWTLSGAEVRGTQDAGAPLSLLGLPESYWPEYDPDQPYFQQLSGYQSYGPVPARLFVDSILSGAPTAPSFLDGWRAQQVIDAAFASSRDRKWVTLGGSLS